MQFDESRVASLVEEVLRNLASQGALTGKVSTSSQDGVYDDLQAAMAAVIEAQKKLMALPFAKREELVRAIRKAGIDHAEEFGKMAQQETRLGRAEDKKIKNINSARLTPGVEDLPRETLIGSYGISMVKGGPYGIIVSILPTTHPTAIVINHAIAMIASGNGVFFCPHPRGYKSSLYAMQVMNRAIVEAGGPADTMVALAKGSMEAVTAACAHPAVGMIVATGGPAVVDAALRSGKKAIGAGPGNPPVLVDETADLVKAAKDILDGASFDNNILCIAEKTIIAVESIAEELKRQFLALPEIYWLSPAEASRVEKVIFPEGKLNGELVGKDAAYILGQAGIRVDEKIRLAIMETGPSNQLVDTEQLMPVLPFVRVRDFEAGMKLALESEHGDKHTAVMHTKDLTRVDRFARTLDVTALVVNSASGAALAVGGEGKYAHTLAGPTGEGVCTPRTFTREIRVTIGDSFGY